MSYESEPKTPEISLREAREFATSSLLPQSFDLLRNHFGSRRLNISSKGFNDIVTKADLENEQLLISQLIQKFPQSQILGEESSPEEYLKYQDKKNLWIIDPLDGTVNFSRGNLNFAVSVALVDQGKTRLGLVGIPSTGEIFWAQQGVDGVFDSAGEKFEVSEVALMNEATFRCDWVYNPDVRIRMSQLLGVAGPKVRQILSGGSAVADIIGVAKGQVDIYFNPGLKPWDTAASCFMVEKAGGRVTTVSGGDWNVFDPDLIITNGALHEEFVNLVNETKLFS